MKIPDKLKDIYKTYIDSEFNYEAHRVKEELGGNWNHDTASIKLPSDLRRGQQSFEIAKEFIRKYKFPNPKRVIGYYDPNSGLLGRTMLLRASFLGVTVCFGVRVTKVIDEMITTDCGFYGQNWGYSYRTLEGHWEIGEITFVLSHDFDNGTVTFTVKSYSKADRIPNLIHRIGFAVFGRHLQKQFAKESLQRVSDHVREELIKRAL